VAAAIASTIDRPPAVARTLDIGSGHSTTILEVATAMAGLAGAPEPVVSGAFRDGDVRAASCVIEPARSALEYAPAWSLADGLEALVTSAGSELGER
jgi:dTDP-L-rhamnose 4-epimerase